MNEVKAYEVEGKLFMTTEEAKVYALEFGLRRAFASLDGYEIINNICYKKTVRNELIRLIEEFNQA